MKFTLITNPYDIMFETDIINRLFREGLNELHVRKPQLDKKELTRYIGKINEDYHSRLVLHDYYSLVHHFDISTIHIGEGFRKDFFKRMILNKIILKGKKVKRCTTINSYKSLYRSKDEIDEVMLGPIFVKSSSAAASQYVKTDSLLRALEHSPVPVIGLGGVSMETITFFKNIGFNGVALQSNIWKSQDPVGTFMNILSYAEVPVSKLKVVN